MYFTKNAGNNDLRVLEEIIFPVIKRETSRDVEHYNHVKSLFLNAFKEAKIGWIKRNIVWLYIARSLDKGIQQGKSLYEIEQNLRAFFRKRIDFEKETKPATIKRSEKNFAKIREYLVGDRILDLGAGDGLLAKQIQEKLKKEVLLVDVVDYNFTDLPLLLYEQDGSIPLGENQVDTTVLYVVLHHADDPEHVLAEASRVTRKRLVILEGYIEEEKIRVSNAFIDWYFNRVIRDADINVPLNYAKLEVWEKLLEKNGFGLAEHKYLGIDEPMAPEHHMLLIADKQN